MDAVKVVYIRRDVPTRINSSSTATRPTAHYVAGPSVSNAPRLQRVQHSVPTQARTSLEPHPIHIGNCVQRWVCQICRKSLSSKRSYKEHMNIHNHSRPFQCDHCEYAAASQMTLRRHVLRNHTARRDWGYRCPYCPQSYMEPASYQQHIQSRHLGRSATFGCPYVLCTFVSKCFRHFREHLAKHESYETFAGPSERLPYSCPDDFLKRYLVDDEYGVGFASSKRQVLMRKQKTVIYTNDRISRGAGTTVFEKHNDFMKEPLRMRPVTAPTVRRRVVHHSPYDEDDDEDDLPPILESQEVMPPETDWIENEVEVSCNELNRLPDGQIDLELD